MSEKKKRSGATTKRVNKTKEEIKKDMQDAELMKFKKALQEIEEAHGFRLEPVLYFSEMGVLPQIKVVKREKEEGVV